MAYFCLKLSDFDLAGGMRNRGLPKWADPQLRPKNHEEDAMANPRTPHAFASTRKAFKTASGKTGEFYSLPALAREFNTALNKVLADPQIQEKLTDMSLEPAQTTLDEASQEMEEINRFWENKLGARR